MFLRAAMPQGIYGLETGKDTFSLHIYQPDKA